LFIYSIRMSDSIGPSRTHPAALLSFVLGLSSLGLCLLGLTGVPALLIGLRGLRAVNMSEGRFRGARLAVAGMILGGIGTVITVLGTCVLIAIQVRETSNRAESADNLRRIGISLNTYADTHKRFPAATSDPPALPPDRRLSWFADIVVLLDEGTPRARKYQAIAGEIDRTKAWDDPANAAVASTPVRLFLCRGHPDYAAHRSSGMTHYVGLAGIDPRAANLPRDHARAGMFGHGRGVRRAEVTRGISATMMVLETAHENCLWLAGGFPTVRGLEPDETRYLGPGRPFGGVQSGVVTVLYVDGSARFVPDTIEPEVFRAQARIHRQDAAK
jgi:hypothetical protein